MRGVDHGHSLCFVLIAVGDSMTWASACERVEWEKGRQAAGSRHLFGSSCVLTWCASLLPGPDAAATVTLCEGAGGTMSVVHADASESIKVVQRVSVCG